MLTSYPIYGTFTVPGLTQTANTAIFQGIPPYPGPPGTAPFLYSVSGNPLAPNWTQGQSTAITHVTTLHALAGSTARTLATGLMLARPHNWTTVKTTAAAAQTVINITADPGVFSTNYRYPLPGVVPSAAGLNVYPGAVADDPIAAGDYVAYQLPDGTWFWDKVASVSTLAITMTANVPTGGVNAGAPYFFYGVPGTDKDPATGQLDPAFTTIVSVQNIYQDYIVGIANSLHRGDPMMFFDANATAADFLNFISGFYSPY